MVKPKKHLGQHFLTDLSIAERIVESLEINANDTVIEVGPGTGVLTQYLVKKEIDFSVVEIDDESVEYLEQHYSDLKIVNKDFLRLNLVEEFGSSLKVIGNFPYNISSQIFFKVLEFKDDVTECVGMLQKEVAERIASPHGNKTYGILSVFLQAYYDIDYLFTVEPEVFNPPPKVRSAVIRLKRNETKALDCSEKLFFTVVKQGFNNRRKTLRNALKSFNLPPEVTSTEVFSKRAEQLSVNDFVELTKTVASALNGTI